MSLGHPILRWDPFMGLPTFFFLPPPKVAFPKAKHVNEALHYAGILG